VAPSLHLIAHFTNSFSPYPAALSTHMGSNAAKWGKRREHKKLPKWFFEAANGHFVKPFHSERKGHSLK